MSRCLTSASDIKQLGTILSIWAHPDDESFMAGGVMAAAVNNGQKVICVTATKGEAGVQDESLWPASRLASIRASEMEESLAILGITIHHWLGYPDGGCKDVDQATAIDKLTQLIDRYQPDTILTFGPDGITGHDDHKAVSRWATKAAAKRNIAVYHAILTPSVYEKMQAADSRFNLFFNVDKPLLASPQRCAILLDLDEEFLKKKYQCLCAMPSQTKKMFEYFGEKTICEMLSTEAFVLAVS